MGEILSQNEIDELLNALNSGDTSNIVRENDKSVKDAKNYNFARPSKFNKEQLRALEIIFENYSRVISSFLSGYLRTSTSIEVVNAEQVTYGEFNNSLVNPVILSIIEFKPFKGSIILEMSANLGFSIIDRILGGPGLSIKKLRDFSEIEKILLERVVLQLVNYLVEPWENISPIEPRLEKIETNSQLAQIISPNEMMALVTLSVKIGTIEGLINFCIPHIVIEPSMKRLNTKYWFTTKTVKEDTSIYKEKIETQLEETEVPVSVLIGKTNINIGDFLNLQVGDIIPVDSYISSDLNVMVGNLLKFQGKPGVSRGKNAIQITSLVGRRGK